MSKQEALGVITSEGWFQIEPEDKIAYPSNLDRGCTEARWRTGICWARKDGVEAGLLEKGRWDNWNLQPAGLDKYEEISRGCKGGELPVRLCYLWSVGFKRKMYPAYELGNDAKRPLKLYDDWFVTKKAEWMKDLLLGLDF